MKISEDKKENVTWTSTPLLLLVLCIFPDSLFKSSMLKMFDFFHLTKVKLRT